MERLRLLLTITWCLVSCVYQIGTHSDSSKNNSLPTGYHALSFIVPDSESSCAKFGFFTLTCHVIYGQAVYCWRLSCFFQKAIAFFVGTKWLCI